jgi:GH24 family phage-related lysozyme (muramidase)
MAKLHKCMNKRDLNEEPIAMSPEVNADYNKRALYVPMDAHPAVFKSGKFKIGEVGPYHIHQMGNETYPDYHITHPNESGTHKLVGTVQISRTDRKKNSGFHKATGHSTHLSVSHVRVHQDHRGKKSKVEDLVPKVYQAIANHNQAPLLAGSDQSKGAADAWARLAKIGKVHLFYDTNSHMITPSGERIPTPVYNNLHAKMEYTSIKKPNLSPTQQQKYAAKIAKRIGQSATSSPPTVGEPYEPKKHSRHAYSETMGSRTSFILFPETPQLKEAMDFKNLVKGTAIGLGLAGSVIGGHKLMPTPQPSRTAITSPTPNVGSGKVVAKKKEEKSTPTAHGIASELITGKEGFETKAYNKDGHWTIGYGNTRYSNGKAVQPGDTVTREEAQKHYTHHLENVVSPKLAKLPHWGKMSPHQQAAMMSFSYNVGENFYGRKGFESISGALSHPDNWHRVPAALTKYNKSEGKVLPGLVTRRKAEGELWSTKKD